jgi:sugar lactone lactonase YvrE
MQAAHALAPDNPVVLYNLARAEARAGDASAALRALERLARQGAVRDVAADSAFAALRADARFGELTAALARAAEPVARSDTAFALGDPDLVPEGIAYDAADDAFYVGGLHGRTVLRVRRDGTRRAFAAPRAEGLGQVLGLRVDAARRTLWLATLVPDSAAPRFQRGIGGWAFLHAYDLRTGRRTGRWAAPDSSRPHLLNDVAVTAGGDVYVTDSEGGALWRLRRGAARLERVHGGAADFTYPNGVAVSTDGRRLYVAHVEGLSALPLGAAAGARPTRVRAPWGTHTGGIDGLYACGDGLLAVQQMLDFPQITRFALTAAGDSVTGTRALERRHPGQRIPTTGALAGDAFFYIADAQLDRLQPEGGLTPSPAPRDPIVLRLPLDGACGTARAP